MFTMHGPQAHAHDRNCTVVIVCIKYHSNGLDEHIEIPYCSVPQKAAFAVTSTDPFGRTLPEEIVE